jgi:hypothetical protein
LKGRGMCVGKRRKLEKKIRNGVRKQKKHIRKQDQFVRNGDPCYRNEKKFIRKKIQGRTIALER